MYKRFAEPIFLYLCHEHYGYHLLSNATPGYMVCRTSWEYGNRHISVNNLSNINKPTALHNQWLHEKDCYFIFGLRSMYAFGM